MVEVSYTPTLLKSMSEICDAMGVGQNTVREWAQAGAPIAIEKDDKGNAIRYRSELMRLYVWLEKKEKGIK